MPEPSIPVGGHGYTAAKLADALRTVRADLSHEDAIREAQLVIVHLEQMPDD